MSGPQHPFSPNFVGAAQNDMRAQFAGPQRGQLSGISSPSQPSVGIASPQTYNVNVNMQTPADSPIPTQQLQQAGPPTPQQLQLHLQQRQQQPPQPAVGSPQPPTPISQQAMASQQIPVSQQTVLPPLQQVPPPVSQNIPTHLDGNNVTIQSVPQSSAGTSVAVSPAVVSGSAPQNPATQQYNTASLCMFGQETVQDIVTKLQEMFQILKFIPPPSGLPGSGNVSIDRKLKLCECLKFIRQLFKRLRMIYERVNDSNQLPGTEYMHIESLIPLKEEWDVKTSEERKTSESYRLASEECKELIDQVIVRNDLLKEVVDRMRRLVWEVNTMLMMRKS